VKNFLKLLLLFGLIIGTSCSKDDETTNHINVDIVGTWEVGSYNYNSVSTTTFLGEDIVINAEGKAENIDMTITFKEDNTTVSDGKIDIRLTTETLGQTEVIVTENLRPIKSGTYTYRPNDGKIDFDSEEFDIISITDKKMELSFTTNRSLNNNLTKVVVNGTLILVR
jgi:hypothetical protein